MIEMQQQNKRNKGAFGKHPDSSRLPPSSPMEKYNLLDNIPHFHRLSGCRRLITGDNFRYDATNPVGSLIVNASFHLWDIPFEAFGIQIPNEESEPCDISLVQKQDRNIIQGYNDPNLFFAYQWSSLLQKKNGELICSQSCKNHKKGKVKHVIVFDLFYFRASNDVSREILHLLPNVDSYVQYYQQSMNRMFAIPSLPAGVAIQPSKNRLHLKLCLGNPSIAKFVTEAQCLLGYASSIYPSLTPNANASTNTNEVRDLINHRFREYLSVIGNKTVRDFVLKQFDNNSGKWVYLHCTEGWIECTNNEEKAIEPIVEYGCNGLMKYIFHNVEGLPYFQAPLMPTADSTNEATSIKSM